MSFAHVPDLFAPAPTSVDDLSRRVADALSTPALEGLVARSVYLVQHGTRLAGSPQLYRNRYVMVRCEAAFGVCSVDATPAADRPRHARDHDVDEDVIDLSGQPLVRLLSDSRLPVRVAALDAALGALHSHREDPRAERVALPTGTPDERAVARDAAIASLVTAEAGQNVALIGVVNPLVAAIRARGAECLPCDLAMERTHWGDLVERDMHRVLEKSDAVVATGMTLGNGTFDVIRDTCLRRGIPLTVYAQTGAAVARAFLGAGVSALCAEPVPLSQMTADESPVYLYRASSAPASAAASAGERA